MDENVDVCPFYPNIRNGAFYKFVLAFMYGNGCNAYNIVKTILGGVYMKVETKNGNLLLTKSDTILVYENEDLTLTLDEQFKLIFQFIEDSTIKENKMEFEDLDTGIKIKLINFNNPIGIATNKEIPFASANGKSVYLSFAVYSISKTKLLHYNIYTEQ